MRTTIDIDPVVFAELKRRQAVERKTLGALVSELLAAALAESVPRDRSALSWPEAALGARIDIDDKNALWAALDDA
ncbi:antitoxin [Nakamurella sp. GG22]